MTHPFDEIAVEAGAKAAWEEEAQPRPMRLPLWSDISDKERETWRGISHATLSAAFKSARDRGMAMDDRAHENCFSKQWINIGHCEDESTFPVTIIRHKENER